MIQGPNVKKLIIQKMSTDAVPSGGGLKDAVEFLSFKDRIINGVKVATKFVEESIKAVREAADPNPWRAATDEEIAGEILRQVERKRSLKR